MVDSEFLDIQPKCIAFMNKNKPVTQKLYHIFKQIKRLIQTSMTTNNH